MSKLDHSTRMYLLAQATVIAIPKVRNTVAPELRRIAKRLKGTVGMQLIAQATILEIDDTRDEIVIDMLERIAA